MTSSLRMAVIYDVLRSTDSLHQQGGKVLGYLESDKQFIPRVVLADKKVAGRWLIFNEESFVKLFLEMALQDQVITKRYHVSYHIVASSKMYYRTKYKDALRKIKSIHYAAKAYGNKKGARPHPAVIIPKEVLEKKLSEGKGTWTIASEIKTSEYFVRKNMARYGIGVEYRLPPKMGQEWETLKELERFSPGITEAAKVYYKEPQKYFEALYGAYLKVFQLVWFIQDQGSLYNRQRDGKVLAKSHICWNTNKGEMILALGLIYEKVPHVRCFVLEGNKTVDFAFPGTNLLVEVDGSAHTKAGMDKKDKEKDEVAKKKGYRMLRIPRQTVEQDLPKAISNIKQALLNQ